MSWFVTLLVLTGGIRLIHSGKPPVVVHGSGVLPVGEKSISLVFYADVENKGTGPVTVGLEMERCCQMITENDTDCESMVLFSGLRVELRPNRARNLTMYFSNMYLLGRSGSCWLKVLWKASAPPGSKRKFTDGEKFEIPFDLRSLDPNFIQKVIGSGPSKCSSVDQDPKNHCNQVNCLIKYNGFRSFFNKTRQRCEPTPLCYDPNKPFTEEMESKPTHRLSKITNKCIKIKPDTPFTDEMKEVTKEMPELGAYSFRSYPMKLNCVNGKKVENFHGHSTCKCDQDWTSLDFPAKTFNPAVDTYTMCDQRTAAGKQADKTQKASFNLTILIICLAILGLLLCVLVPYYTMKWWKRRKYSPLSTEDDSKPEPSASKVINEVKNRREAILQPMHPFNTKPEYLQSHKQSADELLRLRPSPSRTSSRNRMIQRSTVVSPAESKHKITVTVTTLPNTQYLRFPEKVTRVPPYPEESCPCSEPESESEECYPLPIQPKESWSIPSVNANRCTSCYSFDRPRLVGASVSADCFPRRVESCTCAIKSADNPATISNVIQLKAIRPDAPSDFCETKFDGHSPKQIEQAARKLRQELTEDVTGTWSPESMSALSRSSSTLTTLTEFWREDNANTTRNRAHQAQQEREKKGFWVDPFMNSLRH